MEFQFKGKQDVILLNVFVVGKCVIHVKLYGVIVLIFHNTHILSLYHHLNGCKKFLIELDKIDYFVAAASGVICGMMDILWVGEFDRKRQILRLPLNLTPLL